MKRAKKQKTTVVCSQCGHEGKIYIEPKVFWKTFFAAGKQIESIAIEKAATIADQMAEPFVADRIRDLKEAE